MISRSVGTHHCHGCHFVARIQICSFGTFLRGRLLFLTASAGYVHEVVKRPKPTELSLAERELTELLRETFDVTCTQQPGDITAEVLSRYDVVAFYTTGELAISEEGKQALLDFVRNGGGFAGIHPATDTFYQWPEYGTLIGGRFNLHPWHQKVRLTLEDSDAFATQLMDSRIEITDEIYQFKDWSRDNVHVLLTLDTTSVDLEHPSVRRDDRDFAISWWRPHGKGRVFYTALGHRPEVWRDPRFRHHLHLGILHTSPRHRPKLPFDKDGWLALGPEDSEVSWRTLELGQLTRNLAEADRLGWMTGHLTYVPEESWRNLTLRAQIRRFAEGGSTPLFFRLAHGGRRRDGITRAVRVTLGEGAIDVPASTQWHDLEVTLVGRDLTTSIDGRVVDRRTVSGRAVGHIGLRLRENRTGGIWIRDMRVKRLPDEDE